MHHKSIGFLLVITLVSMLAGCNLPGGSTSPAQSDALGTIVYNTAQAIVQATLAQAIVQATLVQTTPPTVLPSDTPMPSDTPAAPTETSTPTLEPTQTTTPTPEIPGVSVSIDTNCRTGPGRVYDLVGALLVNERAEVIARDPSGEYWYIANPDRAGGYCWLWGEYASTSGNVEALPVYTPIPTPTPTYTPTPFPDFKVDFSDIDSCIGWYAKFVITNSGQVAFDSYSVSLRDRDTSTTVTSSANIFEKANGCLTSETQADIDPGDSGWIYSGAFLYDPDNNDLEAKVTLCSEDDLKGICVTKVLRFKP